MSLPRDEQFGDDSISTAPRSEPRSSVDDYQQWEGAWELWNGVAISMTPSPFGRHAKALTDMAAAFKQAVDRATSGSAACQAVVLTEIDWIVARDTVVCPDLVVVRTLRRRQAHPSTRK